MALEGTPTKTERSTERPVGRGDKLRSWGKVGVKLVGSLCGLAVLLIIVNWWLARPMGHLRLAAADVVIDANLREQLTDIFVTATARIDDARRYHMDLSFVEDERAYNMAVQFPTMPDPKQIELKDLFTADIAFAGEASGLSYSLEFKPISTLEKIYKEFGYIDYFLVIRGATPAECNEPSESNCLRIMAQYFPSTLPPSELQGSAETLASDLAVLVMRGAVQAFDEHWAREHRSDARAIPPYQRALDTAETMRALERAAYGFRVLRESTSHEDCATTDECKRLALTAFDESLKADGQRNAAAALGAALIELDAALVEAKQLAPVLKVERHLRVAEERMMKARRSEFLRARLGPEFLDPLDLVDIHDSLVSEPASTSIRSFACAMAEYRRGRWENCLTRLDGIKALPAALQPYVYAAALDSRVNQGRLIGDTAPFVRLAEDIDGAPQDAISVMRQLVFLRHACQLGTGPHRETVEHLVDPTSTRLLQARWFSGVLYAAACWEGQRVPSVEDVDTVIQAIEAIDDTPVRLNYELKIGALLSRRGAIEEAVDRAMLAIELPWSREMLLNAPEFSTLQQHDEPFRRLMRAAMSQGHSNNVESCIPDQWEF